MTNKYLILAGICIIAFLSPYSVVAQKNNQTTLQSSAYDWNTLIAEKTKTGEKRQVLNSPTATLDNLEIHVTTLNPGETAHPPHQHPEEELTIIKEGTVEALVDGKLKTMGVGSVIFQAANQWHNIKNVGKTIAVYYAIKWKSCKTAAAIK